MFCKLMKFSSLLKHFSLSSCYFGNTLRTKATMTSPSSKNLIAICQMTARNNKEENLTTCFQLIQSAKAQNAKMVFLPEGCDFIGESKAETIANGEPLTGQTVQRFCQMAKDNQIWLSLGGILEKTNNERMVHNSHVVINESGDIVSIYRKIHLFNVDIPEKKIRIMESDYVLAGEEIVPPIETPVGNVGLEVCYDMRFPELSLTLTRMGAEILTLPSAFTFATGAAHWETLLRARAIETQCYVVAAAQTGDHNKKRSSWGHAMVVNPWGVVIVQCNEGTNIAIAEIDLPYLRSVRSKMPVWQHRRNDLYAEMSPLKTVENLEETYNEKTEYVFGQTTVNSSAIFCKTDKTLAFTNKKCVVPGHVLVIPLRCVQTLSELTKEEVTDLFMVVGKVQKVLEALHGVSSTTVGIQTGKDAGQSINHLHVHILPRRPGDLLDHTKLDADYNKSRTLNEMAEEASLLRQYFH